MAVFSSCALPNAGSAAEAVKLSDLDGAQLTAVVTFDRQIYVNGRQSADRVSNNWQIRINGNSLRQDYFSINTGPDGNARRNPTVSGSWEIGKPRAVVHLGNRNGVWIFEAGKLMNLQTYREGAFRLVIAFNRTAGGLGCSAQGYFARERGGTVEFQTERTGQDIKVLSTKTVQTSCQVSQ